MSRYTGKLFYGRVRVLSEFYLLQIGWAEKPSLDLAFKYFSWFSLRNWNPQFNCYLAPVISIDKCNQQKVLRNLPIFIHCTCLLWSSSAVESRLHLGYFFFDTIIHKKFSILALRFYSTEDFLSSPYLFSLMYTFHQPQKSPYSLTSNQRIFSKEPRIILTLPGGWDRSKRPPQTPSALAKHRGFTQTTGQWSLSEYKF